MPKMKFNSNLAERRIASIEKALTSQQLSLQQLSESVYLTRTCCRYYINYLTNLKKLHLCKWRHDEINGREYWVALYTWGNGREAHRPKESSAKRQRRKYKERKVKDPCWYMQYLAKQKAKRIKPRQDIASSWIARV